MITRFALLRHEVPADFRRGSHWDLLLEREVVCWTWALEELPAGIEGDQGPTVVEALRLPDHRKHYLEYEGPVSKDRGVVTRVLEGQCQWQESTDQRICVQLASERGVRVLLLESSSGERWQLSVR